jgi:hypothetical protein
MSDSFTVMRNSQVENCEILLELLQLSKGLQKGFLHSILGVFAVVRDVLSNSKEFAVISFYKFLERGNITSPTGMDKGQIVACQRLHCEL